MNANNKAAFKACDEVFDGTFMLTLGGPLDAPEVLPAGSMVAEAKRSAWTGEFSYNKPQLSVTVRA